MQSPFECKARELTLHLRSIYRDTNENEWKNLDDVLQTRRFRGEDRDFFVSVLQGSRWRDDYRFEVYWRELAGGHVEYWFRLSEHLLTNRHGQ